MKSGINLASKPSGGGELSPRASWLALFILGLISAVHIEQGLRARAARARMKDEVARQEEELRLLARRSEAARLELASPAAGRALRRLAAFERAGALDAVPPAEVLSALAAALPAEARVISLGLQLSSPTPRLAVEVAGRGSETATELTRRLSRSSRLAHAEVLEERPSQNGEYRFRIAAEVRVSGGSR